MDPLLYARAQMGTSLAFHIVFAAIGIALPLMMAIAELAHDRTRDSVYLELSKRWAKGTAILFAVGAVSGTVLSFELGLLWPQFMGRFGELVGLPFALEGFAFFTEAIFLGIFLYGRERVGRRMYLFAAFMVAFSGAASAFFVTLVNSFMNSPTGFELVNGELTQIDPLKAMFSPAWAHQTVHVLLSCYAAIGWLIAGIHAFMLLRFGASRFHEKALAIAVGVGAVAALLLPISGDRSAKYVAQDQPTKFAAMESHYTTQTRAPLRVGPSSWGIEIPGALSFLAAGDFDAEVKGLNDIPRDQWPPVEPTHLFFQVMVGCGSALAGVSIWAIGKRLRRQALSSSKWFLRTVLAVSPLGLVAMESGWMVTELGRQPWVVRGALLTRDAVTPFPHLAAPFWIFTIVYAFLGVVVIALLRAQVMKTVPAGGPR